MAFSWEWTIGGRKVPSNRVAEELARSALAVAKKGIVERIGGVRCPAHARTATDVQVTEEQGEIKFTYKACCDQLRAAIEGSFR